MEARNKFIVTINRQFGTGGHVIGERLAERLGVKFVDKEILSSAAKLLEVDKTVAEKLAMKKPSWWDDFVTSCSMTTEAFSIENQYDKVEPSTKQLFQAQSCIIRQIAEMESCVIIGRCGFDILKDEPNTLKIFLHSPIESRVKRIAVTENISENEALKKIKKMDELRESYTKAYTGKYWWDARNYDFCIDVDKMSVEKAVDKILELAPSFITF